MGSAGGIDVDWAGGIIGTTALVASWLNSWQVLGAWYRYFCINNVVEPQAPLPPHNIFVCCICLFLSKARYQHRLHSSVVRIVEAIGNVFERLRLPEGWLWYASLHESG